MEGVDPGIARAPPRERRKPGDGGVFTFLFVISGLVIAAIPVVMWFYFDHNEGTLKPHTIAWLIASVFVAITIPISLWEIVMHLRYLHQPMLQVPVIRVLWMVPIYAVDSWLALRFSLTQYRDISIYINTARECYEAFVVYSFLVFLARYVALNTKLPRRSSSIGTPNRSFANARLGETASPGGGDRGSLSAPLLLAGHSPMHTHRSTSGISADSGDEPHEGSDGRAGWASPSSSQGGGRSTLERVGSGGLREVSVRDLVPISEVNERLREVLGRKQPVNHLFPLCGIRPWKMKSTAHHKHCEFFSNVKFGVSQYVSVKLCCALAAFVLKPMSLWDEGTANPSRGYFWAAMITNFSQCWALYCLVLFYIGLKNELKPLNPVGKFIAVKAIVFFSFWQSVAVALLVRLGVIADADIFPETSDSTFLVAATQDFLICIEMFVFACYHHSVFSYKEFLVDEDDDEESQADAGGGSGSTPPGGGWHAGRGGGDDCVTVDGSDGGRGKIHNSFQSSLRAMMDLEEVWKDTRGSLNPILPRKPYPVFRLPGAGRGGSAIDPLMEASETLTEIDEEAQEGAGVGSGVEDLD